ncbi:hypothetical protein EV363DRAFT_1438229 [Boletus edulis]|nr:hypothetical protein EV363DRAFT_1438229 [Boletus edulis]
MQGSGPAKRMRRYNPWKQSKAILFVYADIHDTSFGRNTNKGMGEEIYPSTRDIRTKRPPGNDVRIGIGKHTGAVQVVRGRRWRKRGGTDEERQRV